MIFLDVFFRFLNFALFAGIIGYYFRTRLLTSFYAQIRAKVADYTATTSAIKQAKNDFKALQGEIEAQETEYSTLQEKIALWKIALQQKDELCAQRQITITERLEERMLLREKTQMLCKEAQRVFPLIMDQTAQELKHAFINNEQQQSYNQKVLDALEHIARAG